MRIVQQSVLRPHLVMAPPFVLAAKYRPLAERIVTGAGVALTAPSRDRARAIVGWVAANAIHPAAALHPDGTTARADVLPEGETWASFNAVFDKADRLASDNAYWYGLYPAGGVMLERLVGTIAADGTIATDGMLVEVAPGKWRIRDFASFRAVQCTLQCKMAQVLLGAIGIPTLDITTVAHDPMAYYDAEQGRWLYIDPTFGEMLTQGGVDLSSLDLISISLAGDADEIVSSVLPGAEWLAERYFKPANVAAGMSMMVVYVDPQWMGGFQDRRPYRFRGLGPQLVSQPPATVSELMPIIGCGFAGVDVNGATIEVRLVSNWPGHTSYQRSLDRGATWTPCGAVDYLREDVADARYRSVDASGFAGAAAILSRAH
ncbi:hypothetical protein [uncultured Sphingomonas sp.]|uniref:hypothetical protein n=1 Tax=uncultured Sphingomonas sp. TaxID=158754 RepID=UPI0025E87B56|nr:hypothetical protein [uncultured Sphingomonas sp.]